MKKTSKRSWRLTRPSKETAWTHPLVLPLKSLRHIANATEPSPIQCCSRGVPWRENEDHMRQEASACPKQARPQPGDQLTLQPCNSPRSHRTKIVIPESNNRESLTAYGFSGRLDAPHSKPEAVPVSIAGLRAHWHMPPSAYTPVGVRIRESLSHRRRLCSRIAMEHLSLHNGH